MISGCNNTTCTLRGNCYRGQVKTELGDTYIMGEVIDGKCDVFIPLSLPNNRSDEFDEFHALDMVMNDMLKDLSKEDINIILDGLENPSDPNDKLKEAAVKYTKEVTQRAKDGEL